MLYAVSKGRIPNPVTRLVDSKIEAAENLLKMKFPLIHGLQGSSVRGIHVTPATSELVQVINTDSHLVCLSTLSCPTGVVRVYDSLYGCANDKAGHQGLEHHHQ